MKNLVITGFVCFFIFFASDILLSQKIISGTVTEAETGESLISASVLIKGFSTGTVTDFDGAYTLEVPEGASILVFSYTGFKEQEIEIGNQSIIDVALSAGEVLEEVVVVGYRTSTKKELTGAVSVIKSEAIEKINPNRVEQALQGQTPGVQISSQSGSPGGGYNIRIRGISTNGNNNPLILVDGVRYEDLSSLNPSSIESVNILKDATAGIYGVQGANGVILITTKQGRKNQKPQISLNMYSGIQETARKIPLLNATEYAILVNESYANAGSLPPFTDVSTLGEGTDWQDEVFEQVPVHNASLSVRGGGDKTTYSIGAGYFSQDGIVGGKKSNFERYTANLNFTANIVESLKFESVLNYTGLNRQTLLENALGSVLFNALNMAPTLTPFDADGEFTLADGLGSEVINPLAQIDNTYNKTDVNRLNGRVGLKYNIINGLSFSSTFGFNYSVVGGFGFGPEVFYGTGKVFNNVESSVAENQQIFSSTTLDNVLFYDKNFGDRHAIKATLGSSIHQENYEGLFASGFGIPANSIEFASLGLANEIRQGGAGSGVGKFRLLSYFTRLEYNYNQKYIASFILRRDGTSRFGPNNKFGYFPAISVGWIVSEEDFLSSATLFDYLKLRASYGETGNDKIGDFRYISTLNGEAEYVFNGQLTNGVALGPIANPAIQWERNKQFNIGVDASLLTERVSVSLDYYTKTSNDLLLAVPVSGLTGVSAPGSSAPIANAGSIKNSGLEFQITYKSDARKDLGIDVGYNFTTLTNTTLGLNDGVAFISGGFFGIGQSPPTRWEVGQPIGFFYGYKTDGIFQNANELENGPRSANAGIGDVRYVDTNNDGEITVLDRVRIGNPIPKFTMGLNINLNYKNFDVSAFTDAQIGNDIIRNYGRNLPLTNKTSYFADRWNGPGTSTSFPKLSIGANDNDLFSDQYIEDGSYARIKNVQLGYTFPKNLISRIGFSKLRIYASVNNLYTFTAYQGYDPNVSSGSPLNAGNDIGYYPQARTYLLGINVNL